MSKVDEIQNRLMNRVHLIRNLRGLSQADLAKAAGVSQSTVAHIESGRKSDPTISTVTKLSIGLGVQVTTLFDSDISTELISIAKVSTTAKERGDG